jgi:hypothetical protein
MSETHAAIECGCCEAALVPLPEFAFCPSCGFMTTDAIRAAVEVAALRHRLAATAAGAISFDVPNALAALNEGAWWQLCGGHAEHFTAGSLARLVRAAGFQIVMLSLTDDERRVHLCATRAAAPTRPSFDLEDDLMAVAAAVEAFPAAMERQIVRWRRVIEEMLGDGKRVVICGSEASAEAFLSKLKIDVTRLARAIDASSAPDLVIVLGDAVADVRSNLRKLGLRPLVLIP